jgi:DNA mismatch repair protein MutS
MSFHSILFPVDGAGTAKEEAEAPDFFHDLNLDQVVAAITAGRDEYNLMPFFYARLTDLDTIAYRQEIMQDLENLTLFDSIKSFSQRVRAARHRLAGAGKRYFKYEKERWFLDAAETYCDAVAELRRGFGKSAPNSRGLLGFEAYLAQYAESKPFETLAHDTRQLTDVLSSIRYCVIIRGGSVTVRHYDSEIDYTAAVEEAFAKFQQGAVKDYRVNLPAASGMNHVEAAVVERVALLNPAVFQALGDFCARHGEFLEKSIVDFEREIQFYIAYLEYAETFKRAGLQFCRPQVSNSRKDVSNRQGFDLALAGKLIREKSAVVCNDFELSGRERIFVVTGPNQGGKTTFARVFGQLHYLASLGCPVPGSEARLFLFDRLFAHFEREEDIKTLRGKLQDDLVRIHRILAAATPASIVIINEIFSSTSVKDGAFLGGKILGRLAQLDLLCVCVTFLDELASSHEKTVSAVATVMPDNPTVRTFRIERRPADGLAYAHAIAEKYRVTYACLKERLKT